MTEAEKSGVDNPYRYSTKEWDEKCGLYYFGARYYCPEIGRWTQRDPVGTTDGPNLYAYVGGDPVASLDRWGLWNTYVHEGLTEEWAQELGIPEWLASLIGMNTDSMDLPPFAWDSASKLGTMKGRMYHRSSRGRLQLLKKRALATCNLYDLGAWLHALQDTFVHWQYHEKWGHWNETAWNHVWPGNQDPDSWFNPANQREARRTERATRQALSEWWGACCGKEDTQWSSSRLSREAEIYFPGQTAR